MIPSTIYLIATLCLSGVCEEHRAPAPAGLVACLTGAQAELARPCPGWTVQSWECSTGERT